MCRIITYCINVSYHYIYCINVSYQSTFIVQTMLRWICGLILETVIPHINKFAIERKETAFIYEIRYVFL